VISSLPLPFRGGLVAIARDWAQGIKVDLPPRQFMILVGLDFSGNLGGVLGAGWVSGAADGAHSFSSFEESPGKAADSQPQASTSSAPLVIVVSPVVPNGAAAPAAPAAEITQSSAWWSQTPHPTVGVVLLIPVSDRAISALPNVPTISPGVLFPPQSPGVARLETGRSFAVSRLSERWDVLAGRGHEPARSRSMGTASLSASSSIFPDRHANRPAPGGPLEPTDSTSHSSPDTVPTRDMLLALAEKIIQESHRSPTEPEVDLTVYHVLKVVACGAVLQTTWLGLRTFAASRTPDGNRLGREIPRLKHLGQNQEIAEDVPERGIPN
jgi:hypothetical protein